jgi:hypothetical protein
MTPSFCPKQPVPRGNPYFFDLKIIIIPSEDKGRKEQKNFAKTFTCSFITEVSLHPIGERPRRKKALDKGLKIWI